MLLNDCKKYFKPFPYKGRNEFYIFYINHLVDLPLVSHTPFLLNASLLNDIHNFYRCWKVFTNPTIKYYFFFFKYRNFFSCKKFINYIKKRKKKTYIII